MMKSFIFAIMLTLSSVAMADTITLGPVSCGTLKQCYTIPNDAALDINLFAGTGAGSGSTLQYPLAAHRWFDRPITEVSLYTKPSGPTLIVMRPAVLV